MADLPLSPDEENEINKAASSKRAEIFKKRIMELANKTAVTVSDNDGTFYQKGAGAYLDEPGTDLDKWAWTTDENGGAKQVGLKHAIITQAPQLDPNTLRQDWGDARAGQEDIDPIISQKLGTVEMAGDTAYDIDNKGGVHEIVGGEDEAYRYIQDGLAKPGESFMSAERLAKKKLREGAEPTNYRDFFPLPQLDNNRSNAVVKSWEEEEDDAENQKMSRL